MANELQGILIKIGAIALGALSILKLLYLLFILTIAQVVASALGELFRIPLPTHLVSLLNIIGAVLAILYVLGVVLAVFLFRVGDNVETGRLTRGERNLWLIVSVAMLIFSLITHQWLLVIVMLLIVAGLATARAGAYRFV
ncbi:MAG: hypothetical protein QXT28_09445 [Thermofilaceae archaeon]